MFKPSRSWISYDVVSVPPMSLPALDVLQSLPTDFTSALDTLQRQNIVDAFARVDFLMKGTIRPKLFQLKCLISLLVSRHVVVKAATGAGKTLAIMLPLFLSQQDGNHCYTIEAVAKGSCMLDNSNLALYFPGSLQVNEFLQFGIPSIAINHDKAHRWRSSDR
jgi:hypothetical protein